MARPSKSTDVLNEEKRSHRTKGEMEQRKEAEQALMTGHTLRERAEVKNNPVAHKEFLRINALLKKIGKNDALYEQIINRYCQLTAECDEMEKKKISFFQAQEELKEEYKDKGAEALSPSAYYKLVVAMQNNILALDKQIQAKRKMMFDIEKECAMTISAAMRSIPKTTKKQENPLLAALREKETS